METNQLFEYATRKKLRFLYKGQISVEDLWDLSVEELDTIFKSLNAQAKRSQEESLLDRQTTEDEVLSVKIGLVRHIVAVKLDEAERNKTARERKQKKQHLMSILAQKQDQELFGKSAEELQKMLDELDEY